MSKDTKTLPGEKHVERQANSHQGERAKRNRVTTGEQENVDHVARMRELIGQLPDASPSGATTIAQKLTEHLDAHLDPEIYNARQAEVRKQQDEEEKVREQRRAAVKQPVEEKPAA
jgi:DNA recombination-dependent growth factor C